MDLPQITQYRTCGIKWVELGLQYQEHLTTGCFTPPSTSSVSLKQLQGSVEQSFKIF